MADETPGGQVLAQTFMFGISYEKLVADVSWAFCEEFSMVGCDLSDAQAKRLGKAYVMQGAMDYDIYDLDVLEVRDSCGGDVGQMVEALMAKAPGWKREAADEWMEQEELFRDEVVHEEPEELDPFSSRLMQLVEEGMTPKEAMRQTSHEFGMEY